MRTVTIWSMLGGLGLVLVSAAARADNNIWTMPYLGSCSNGQCFKVSNTLSAGGWAIYADGGSGNGVDAVSTTAYGLYASSGSNNAVYAVNNSVSGTLHVLNNGNGNSVEGFASGFGAGVQGTSNAGNGVFGQLYGGGGSGVYGLAPSSTSQFEAGIAGRISPAGVGYAVYGDNTSSSGWAGYFTGKVFAQSGFTSSDARLKKDVKDAPYGLSQLLKLRPVSFKWKKSDDDATQLGLIAQEVQTVVPEVVNVDHTVSRDGMTGMLSVNYVGLLPVVIKAVQEQQKIIENQQAQIAALQRAQRPVMSSVLPVGLGGGLALGLLPVGMVFARRRRGSKEQG